MTCQLWVRGIGENNGQVSVDILARDNWNYHNPIPAPALNAEDPRGWSYYFDGFGGIFGGIGWHTVPEYYLVGCSPGQPPPSPAYDCINGQCYQSTQYGTAGVHATLSHCQSVCANGPPLVDYCPPGKTCIPSDEWSQIESLSNAVRNKLCG